MIQRKNYSSDQKTKQKNVLNFMKVFMKEKVFKAIACKKCYVKHTKQS
jgi:hypothetical protein